MSIVSSPWIQNFLHGVRIYLYIHSMLEPLLWSTENILILTVVLLIAGFVKGVVGLGLPTVTLGLLTAFFGLKVAIALMLLPSFATNVIQSAVGGAFLQILRRLWVLLICACVAIWFSSVLLISAHPSLLSAILGLSMCLYGGASLSRLNLPEPGVKEKWMSPLIGMVNGVLTGITGSFVVPGVLYLQGLGWPRDVFIQGMGLLFTVSTIALAIAMSGRGLLSENLTLLSAAGLIPAFVGMFIGQKVRQRLSEERFRQVFFVSIGVLGVFVMNQSLLNFKLF